MNPVQRMTVLMDFSQLKALVKDKILSRFDHALVVNEQAPYAAEVQKLGFERTFTLPFQPTCENLVLHFAQKLVPELPEHLQLQRLRLYETTTSYADWRA